ncbi:MAG: Eco29kI family restriction endonuclease [Dehalococcoidia bacterium]|nr:Eco29kI family restriction endonuclease [Dehalococcoidia bacterium]
MPDEPRSLRLPDAAAKIRALVEELPVRDVKGLPEAEVARARRTLEQAQDRLRALVQELDPVTEPSFIFDPSNPEVIGRIVALALIAQHRRPLGTLSPFYGSGVYAIYYNGEFPAYTPISGTEHPIYVGKADPASPAARTARDQGTRLHRRLNDHKKTIGKVSETLELADFEYRALVVQTGWQSAAEQYLIQLFRPIWNSETGICYGIGKHGDSPTTRANTRSPWDTLHVGREWAHRDGNLPDAKPAAQILEEIAAHLSARPPFESLDDVLRRFLEDMSSPA